MKKRYLSILILFFTPAMVFADAQNKTLQTLHETYAKIENIEADFSQSVTFQGFDTSIDSRGKVYLKRGKMRWDYLLPTRQQFFVEGDMLLHYNPEHQQVIQSVLGKQTGLPLDLFISIEKIETIFHLTPVQKNTLLLKPKETGSQVKQMIVTFAPLPQLKGLFIQKIILHEENGNQSVFVFHHFRVNKALSEQIFLFKIPEGVALIDLR